VFYALSATRIADVTDGTSNTIALGERTVLAAHANDPSKWPSWCGPGGLGIGSTVSSCVSIAMNHPTNMHAFSSHHAAGANFCFVDGSVHFLSDTMDSRDGGVNSGNAGTHESFCQAAAAGQIGLYQILGVINDHQSLALDL
jgi:prepilin-type processing-associated H-X9-DG protein